MIFFTLLFSLFLVMLSYSRYKKLLNPFTLESYYAILFLLIPQICKIILLKEKSYLWSDIVILTNIIAVYCGTLLSIKTFTVAPVANVKISSFLLCSVAVFLIIFTLPILLQYGISFRGIRLYYETVVFTKYASFYDLAKRFIETAVILLLVKYRRFRWHIIFLLLFLAFSGNKFAILNIVLFVALFLEEYRQISTTRIILFFGLAFVILVGFHFATSNVLSDASIWMNALSYFDIYNNQSFLIEKFMEKDFPLYNGQIFFSGFYKYIPRIVWEGKPHDYGFAILNYRFFPEWAKASYMPSFGLGTSFADFGLFSIIFGGFFAGFFRNYVYNLFLRSKKNNASFFLYYYVFDIVMLSILFLIITVGYSSKKNENYN